MKSNFEFLNTYWPALSEIGKTAENYLYSDPNSCIYKLGMFAERLVEEMFVTEGIEFPEYDNTQAARIRILKRESLLPENIDNILFVLRKRRNDAVHAGLDSLTDAQTLLQSTHRLAVWFMEVYGDWEYVAEPFDLPEKEPDVDYASIIADQEAKIADLTEQIEAVKTAASDKTKSNRKQWSEEKAAASDPTEAETRLIIDAQLREAGWEADTPNLRYSKGIRPSKGRNIAIAEWPTESVVNGKGYADYALFIDTQLVGIIEAKRRNKDVAAVVDNQCVEYGKGIRPEDYPYCVGEWDGFRVPFLFAANSRKYFEQLKTKSGIWFRDARLLAYARALRGWYSPDGIKELLKKNIDAADEELENTPMDILRDPDGLALRPYQIKAIERVEEAIRNGKKTALLSMATGTGKTRIVIGMIYRFLNARRFHRILFLVDRNALGEQAEEKFENTKIDRLLPLNDMFIISKLEEKGFDLNAQVKVSTVQSMMKHVLGDGTGVSVSEYDLVIVDEAHRGYLLDKEMSETEMLYRNEAEYLSKYKMVIDYFDAVKIALTATPALHTTEIFGKPVFNYSYREAVVDGFLCDQNDPHDILSRLRKEGIHYKKGQKTVRINPYTNELMNGEELADDLDFDVESFNRKIIVPSFNKSAMEEVAKYIDPEGQGKTLIYAVTDDHADMIVEDLRAIYREKGIPDKAIKKITGSIGDKKTIRAAIKEFENEQYPNIVVTVDLLTTGIDIPKITSLVFMRLVKSRILFEQMLGRATRKCDDIGKEAFDVYDCVGVYEVIGDVTNMKSVTTTESFEELIKSLSVMSNTEQIQAQVEKILAKMHRRMRFFTENAQAQFKDLSDGYSIEMFAETLDALNEENQPSKYPEYQTSAQSFVVRNLPAFQQLDKDKRPKVGKYYDDREDEIISHTIGYGSGQKPEDYLESFGKFIRTHVNEIEALRILVTRPSDLTREGLRSLKLELDRHNFSERQLNSAWKAVTNQDITADIIAFVRQQALGSPLISSETRIKNAFAKLKQEHDFDKNQLNWLKRIESTMLQEHLMDEQMFNEGAFKSNGGFAVIDKRFNGKLREIIGELNTYIYDDSAA